MTIDWNSVMLFVWRWFNKLHVPFCLAPPLYYTMLAFANLCGEWALFTFPMGGRSQVLLRPYRLWRFAQRIVMRSAGFWSFGAMILEMILWIHEFLGAGP
jgi:hypothetical protein